MFIGFNTGELILHLAFSFIGLSVLVQGFMRMENAISRILVLSTSYFVGQFVTVLSGFVSLLFSVKPALFFVPILLASLFILMKQLSGNRKAIIFLGLYLSVLIATTVGILKFDLTILSYDSYRYVLLAKQLSEGISDSSWLLGYSFSMSALQAIGISIFKIDVFRSLVPVSSTMALVACVAFLLSYFRTASMLAKANALLTVVAFATSYFVFFASFYLIPNMLVGIWLMVALISIKFSYSEQESEITWLVFFLALSVFCLARVEGLVFATVFLPVFFVKLDGTESSLSPKLRWYFFWLCVVSVWYAYLYLTFPNATGDFFTTNKLLALAALLVGLVFVPRAVKAIGFLKTVNKNAPLVLIGVSILALILCSLFFQERLSQNAPVFRRNLYETGFWGDFWLYFIPVLPFLILAIGLVNSLRKELIDLMSVVIGFTCLLFLIFFFREQPLRAGFGDSSNRMVLHIFLVLMLMSAMFIGLLTEKLVGGYSQRMLKAKS